ncbi:hypothetical protein EGW08_014691 [Elysia chlorotica]|uniref:Uncharacterized protein n=1 Tax=Elysia chlorotica TaxID=188477 RepID=A0A3S1B1F3_ELYCH|nr:hypothetical protein EGW08_014691 [Elysia chlorotica]
MSLSAVESLIALSDTICPPLANPTPVGSGNYFGPWLTDDKWSPRKHPLDSTVHPKKKTTPRVNQLSKSLPRRLSLYTSTNINNSPYGAQRSQTPVEGAVSGKSKLRLTTRAKSFYASNENRKQFKTKKFGGKGTKISGKGKRGEEETAEEGSLEWEDEEEEEDSARLAKHTHYQKPSLPALITLTSNTNDTRSTFALGRQLELPLPKVYVSAAQRQPARIHRASSARANADSHNFFPTFTRDRSLMNGRWQDDTDLQMSTEHSAARGISFPYSNNGGGRGASQCRTEALKRALEARNPPPPTHNYEDISDHIRHYRIHCTVLGTGRFSLANEPEQSVKPVQWQDLFPNRPLTAGNSTVDVPIFRFSVADFRIQTAPSTKGYRSSPLPLSRAVTPKYLATEGEASRFTTSCVDQTNSQNDGICSDTSTASDEKCEVSDVEKSANVNTDSKSGSLQLEERFARVSRMSSFTVYNDSIQQVKNSTPNQRGEENEYMQYLRAKNTPTRQAQSKHKISNNVNRKANITKEVKSIPKVVAQNAEAKQHSETTGLIPQKEKGEPIHAKLEKKVQKEPKLMKGSNFATRKCEGQYGPSTKAYPKYPNTGLASRGRHLSAEIHEDKRPKLVVDADRLRQSVEGKIHEGERKLRSSLNEAVVNQILFRRGNKRLWQKIQKRDTDILNASTEKMLTSVNQTPDGDDVQAYQHEQEQCSDSEHVNDYDEEDIFEKDAGKDEDSNALTKDNQQDGVLPSHKNIGLVTSYDFKGYVEALRAKTERFLEGKADPTEEDETLEIDQVNQKRSTSESFVGSEKRNWRPKESRVRSAARGGRYRLRYPRKSETRSKSRQGGGLDFQQSSTSARLRYKPTSPATSAFVIAAPPSSSNSTGVGGRSVVLPLEDFMEMAVEGTDQSFADWKTCLNNSSIGSMAAPQSQRSKSDGLLKIVSFATPVNQFIFAKKITFDSTENLGIFARKNKKTNTLEENESEAVEKKVRSSSYRLKLSDFGLPGAFQRKAKSKGNAEVYSGKTSGVSTKVSGDEQVKTKKGQEEKAVGNVEIEKSSIPELFDSVRKELIPDKMKYAALIKKDTLVQNSIDEPPFSDTCASGTTRPPLQDSKMSDAPLKNGEPHKTDRHGSSRQSRSRSVSAEAHACLRKEILRLMETRRSTTDCGNEEAIQRSVEERKDCSERTDIKRTKANVLIDEESKGFCSNDEKRAPTSDWPHAAGSLTFRYNRHSSSVSPRRLRLKHMIRRVSDCDRSLSPSRVHRFFQRRRSSTEVSQHLDLNLPPLTIQGGSLSCPPSEIDKEATSQGTEKPDSSLLSVEKYASQVQSQPHLDNAKDKTAPGGITPPSLSERYSKVTDQSSSGGLSTKEEVDARGTENAPSIRKTSKECFVNTAKAYQLTEPKESRGESIFEKEKLLFSFQITIKLEQHQGHILQEELDFFIKYKKYNVSLIFLSDMVQC